MIDSAQSVIDRVSSLGGVKVIDIAAGSEHSALLTVDGAVKTWGWGEEGQLGLGDAKDQTVPQSVSLGLQTESQEIISKVYCGSGFTYVVRLTTFQNVEKLVEPGIST